MSDISSPELNLPPQKRDQIKSGKNADKSIKAGFKKVAGKVILGTPLAGLILSSGNVDNPNVPVLNIKEPIPASAPKNPNSLDLQIKRIGKKEIKYLALDSHGGRQESTVSPGGRKPTVEEEKAIMEGMETVPYCVNLADEIIFYTEKDREHLGGSVRELLSTIELYLPAKLPKDLTKKFQSSPEERTVWETERDNYRRAFVHECGHLIEYKVYAVLNDVYDPNATNYNPLHYALAKLKGFNYDMKTGDTEIVDGRFGSYYKNKTSREYFPELFAISRLKPEALTDNERGFFDRLHDGLMLKGERFLADVAENPEVLLHDK